MSAPLDLSSTAMVLVHGSWHGAWCWKRVLPLLRGVGVETHAVTLTGVGERAHLLSPAVGIETHVQDIIGLIEAEELQRDLANAKVERVGEGIKITFDSGILFNTNSAQLQSGAQTEIAQLIELLSSKS